MTIERGTTQEITITVKGWDLTGSDIYVTFRAGSKMLTKKNVTSVAYSGGDTNMTVSLSQEETMFFGNNSVGDIQVRWMDASGNAHKTQTAPFDADELLYDAVLTREADNNV